MSEPAIAGTATGMGSWPGTDVREATAIILGELTTLPHIVELPARGLGADMIGRAGALLVDIELDTSTTGYRIGSGRSRAGRAANDYLARDLDVLEELWETTGLRGSGRPIKVQSCGPFTLAAELQFANGHRVLTDRGALRDIVGSLAEGVAVHAEEVARRLGAPVVVQIDEPQLGAVLGGSVVDVTALDRVRAVSASDVATGIDAVIKRVGRPVMVHCCANEVPFEVLTRTAVNAVAFDLASLGEDRYDAVGELVERGANLVLGLVPGIDPARIPTWRESAGAAVQLIDRLGFPRATLRDRVGVSPACGLAGASVSWARASSTVLEQVRRAFEEDPASL